VEQFRKRGTIEIAKGTRPVAWKARPVPRGTI
jgi:hypothetical protein